MLQQQIMDQYAIINTLVANSKPANNDTHDLKLKPNDLMYSEAKANIPSLHPALAQVKYIRKTFFIGIMIKKKLGTPRG